MIYATFWDRLRGLKFFTSETQLAFDEEAKAQLEGYVYIRKQRCTGQGGGVGIYILSFAPFQRRVDLEQNEIDCIWIEILFPKTKSFLIVIMYRSPQTHQNIFPKILVKVLNQC